MEQKTIQVHVSETGESVFSVDIMVSGHHIKGDESVEAGGANLGPAPHDLLTAALGECTAMTIRWYAHQQKWPLEKVFVKVYYRKEGRQDVFRKEINMFGTELTEDQRLKLTEIAAKCPIQRTLEGTPSITTVDSMKHSSAPHH